jgi:CelD/BcsL family acetyltransferase involved in cellulose biosynthesis
VLDLVDDLDRLREEWTALAAATGSVFASWEWHSTWWRHFGGGELKIVVARSAAGREIAILPFYRVRVRGFHVIRLAGHGLGADVALICRPTDRAAASDALALALTTRLTRWDVFQVEALRGFEPALPRATTVGSERVPVIRLDRPDWQAYLAGRSRNFRGQVLRKERRLARDHGLRYRLTTNPEGLEQDLEILFDLHRERWRGLGSRFIDHEAFHREFAREASRQGWLRLWILELEGQPAAAWYGFRFGAAELYYQLGRSAAWSHASPGLVLLAHTIREAIADGVREYRLGRGEHDYKFRFANDADTLVTLRCPGTLRGRVAVAARARRNRWPVLKRVVSPLRNPVD